MESHSHRRRRSNAAGATEEDRLSSLPDDLLHSILRSLPLKQAVRTSALSRRWAPEWRRALAASPVLDLTDRNFARGQPPARAAATVGRCLRLHAEHGAPLDALRVALASPSPSGPVGDGGGAFGRDVVGWVAAAVARGARDVEVDLAPPPPQQDDGAAPHAGTAVLYCLELPGDVFQAMSSLERLALGGFSLRAVRLPAAGLASLRTLSLAHADVTDDAVRSVLAGCGALESLTLRSCPLLTSVTVASGRLRVLELLGCPAVRQLRVAAPALESFAFHGRGYFRETDYYAVPIELGGDTMTMTMPALRDARMCHLGFGEYEDLNAHDFEYPFLYPVAHARVLTLCSIALLLLDAQLSYDEMAYTDLPNLEELQLLMASLDNEGLEHVSTFFMLTPLPVLQRLFIRLPSDGGSSSAAEPTAADDDEAYIIHMFEVVLEQLALIKVANFRGTRRELRLLRFFLKRAPVLEKVVLVTVGGEGAPGDEQLKAIQERVSELPKASREARVSVCRPHEDDSPNHAHTMFYREEEPVGMAGLAAGTITSGSPWGFGVLVADAAAARGIPVVVADGKLRSLVGEAGAGEVGTVERVARRTGIELPTRSRRGLSPRVGGTWKRLNPDRKHDKDEEPGIPQNPQQQDQIPMGEEFASKQNPASGYGCKCRGLKNHTSENCNHRRMRCELRGLDNHTSSEW